jgi:hypothetical protein
LRGWPSKSRVGILVLKDLQDSSGQLFAIKGEGDGPLAHFKVLEFAVILSGHIQQYFFEGYCLRMILGGNIAIKHIDFYDSRYHNPFAIKPNIEQRRN